ncbi:MAG TPA: glutamine--fructose-6-phosphate transaminase (isomerizing) [Myxococcota bacterium]|nr:glutamine--fructose-6-phosphate transaminase (isomerizing) [Myxococcota bacterium]HRY96706.1 glutamine--fructose-6-phosphate transaminase (isomerizing) [Myxococcota bacterium]HSA20206.1 glutamine--fructose-6-phosphate transaminase (isomerizing) [Myxococcota bacterium]
MCGIVGYAGPREATPILMEGLSRLEYRGYDSAGLAVHDGADIRILRSPGKLARLAGLLEGRQLPGTLGIGHTRWATHGPPSEQNAHPHASGDVVLVHNGILENHAELRRALEKKGRRFTSQTDTEVFAHLIDEELGRRPLEQAVARALARVRGTYALAVLSRREPDRIVVARSSSPLVLGLGRGENLVASDIPALLGHTRDFVFLEDGDLAVLTAARVEIRTLAGEPVARPTRRIDWSPLMAEKGGHKHFMHKEIHEQPRALADTLTGRILHGRADVRLDDLRFEAAELKALGRVVIAACGTSYHAGLVAKFLIEWFARLPVEVDLASEFRYRRPVVGKGDLLVAISQSGETADTLAALREAKRLGARTLAVCNAVDASIPRAADGVLYTHAGPEIGVASTKAFVTQIGALFLLAVRLGRARRKLSPEEAGRQLEALAGAPELLEAVLRDEARIEAVARAYAQTRDFLYIARGANYPIALEGALKLKEISYIHAEGYPAGEMKHGPIALIDEHVAVVAVACQGESYEKMLSNLAEVRAREGQVIAIGQAGDEQLGALAQHQIHVPRALPSVAPMVNVLPMQLLAYHIADFHGTDVDQPRNLAKSVTVE